MSIRNPSLHIRKTDLIDILNEMSLGRHTGLKLANEIFQRAEKFQIKDRYLQLLETKSTTKKKVERSMKADSGVPDKLVEKFNLILTTFRQNANKFGRIKPIGKDSKDYLMLKEVAKLAHDFVEEFDISPVEDGYKEFIAIGFGMMRKYALNRYKYYAPKISDIFSDKVRVLMDEDKEATSEFYEVWKKVMIEYTNLEDYAEVVKDDFAKYSCMVLGREEADAAEADYEDWIVAQFEGLSFLNAVPELTQFYGDGSIQRYERYVKNSSVDFEEESSSITDMYDD